MIQQSNQRQGTARNRGLEAAQGEFVYFMDSDDLILPECFETCYQACTADELDFVTFDTVGFLDSPNNPRPDLFPEVKDRRGFTRETICDGPSFWMENFQHGRVPIICWMEYFRRSFLLENDLFFKERIYFEDNDWTLRVFLAAKRLRYLPFAPHRYRERPGSNVHSGFKQVLAESCFDVHRILCKMVSEEADPTRIRMIWDLNNVVNLRFRQFADLSPDDNFKQQTCVFTLETLETIRQEQDSSYAYRMHLETMLNLVAGVREWQNFNMPFDGETFLTLLFPGLSSDFAHKRIALYGTGRVCSILTALIDFKHPDIVFLESMPSEKTTFKNRPVLCVSEAGNMGIEVVLIATTRFAREIIENVHRYLGEHLPVYQISNAIFSLEWLLDPNVLKNGSLLSL